MIEREGKLSPEQEVKPISIELKTKREQEIMLEIADGSLLAGTYEEMRGILPGIREQNDIWRSIFKKLVKNLKMEYKPTELLRRGIVDDFSQQTLEQWSRGKNIESSIEREGLKMYAKHFLKQRRKV